jgi:hemerythrin-like metal-binding protein
MSEFQWTEQLRLGVDPMYRDHQQIIALMNDLESVFESGAPVGTIDRAFKRLADFTRQHFGDEEAYMESINFPQLSPHKLIHQKLLTTMDNHYKQFKQNGALNDEVFTFLRFWLKSHICGIDKKYAELALA